MFYYLKGIISLINKYSVVLDVADVGYEVFTIHSENYRVGDEIKLFTYEVIKEEERYLVGFLSLKEKDLFTQLITVKGIGPKTSLSMMSGASVDDIVNAISSNNTTFLKRLPNVGSKAAQQIILDLKGQLTGTVKGNPKQYDEVKSALQILGFKKSVIDDALASINEVDITNEELMRLALKKINGMKA